MRDLADHMGFKVANIYNFIDSKQTLLETYLFDISKTLHRGIDNIISSSYSPTEKLKSIISLHVSLTAQRPYELALLANEWRNLEPDKLKDFIELRNDYQTKLRGVLEEGVNNGSFQKMDLDITTEVVFSSLRWIYSWYTDHVDTYNPVELERQITEFVLGGVAVRK